MNKPAGLRLLCLFLIFSLILPLPALASSSGPPESSSEPPAPETPLSYRVMEKQAAPRTNLFSEPEGFGDGYKTQIMRGRSGALQNVYEAAAAAPKEDTGITGDAGLVLTLPDMPKGAYTLSGWSRIKSQITLSSGDAPECYGLMAEVFYSGGEQASYFAPFPVSGTSWTYRELSFLLEEPASRVAVYALLRRPAQGAVFFDDISLTRADSAGFFAGIPVKLLENAPALAAEKTLSTGDGLSLSLGQGAPVSLKIGGRELLGDAWPGFLARDAAGTNSGIYAFRPDVQEPGGVLLAPELGLELDAKYEERDGYILVSGSLKDLRGEKDGRAVSLSYALPIDAEGWSWARDIYGAETISTGSPGDIYRDRGSAPFPVSAIYNDELGLAMAVSPEFPTSFALEYNGTTNQYVLNFDLGIAPEAPDAARFEFVIFTLDNPAYGFRSALEKFAGIFPEAHAVSDSRQGLWSEFQGAAELPGAADFNIAYISGKGPVAAGQEGDSLWLYGTAPDSWILDGLSSVNAARIRAALSNLVEKTGGDLQARLAKAHVISRLSDPAGNLLWVPAGSKSARLYTNANPALPGQENIYEILFGSETWAGIFAPEEGKGFDGALIDLSEGFSAAAASFDREQFEYTSVPLSYSRDALPMLPRSSTTWEFARKLGDALRAEDRTLFVAGALENSWFYIPLAGALGERVSVRTPDGEFAPLDLKTLGRWRALAYQKPISVLFDADFEGFTSDMLEKTLARCLSLGIFPSPASAGGGYFAEESQYYERDRALWQKYSPALEKLSRAGWQPVTYAHSDNGSLFLERFGSAESGEIYFTVYNPSDETIRTELTFYPQSLGSGVQSVVTGLFGGNRTTLAENKITVTLEPGEALAYEFEGYTPPTPAPPEPLEPEEIAFPKEVFLYAALLLCAGAALVLLTISTFKKKPSVPGGDMTEGLSKLAHMDASLKNSSATGGGKDSGDVPADASGGTADTDKNIGDNSAPDTGGKDSGGSDIPGGDGGRGADPAEPMRENGGGSSAPNTGKDSGDSPADASGATADTDKNIGGNPAPDTDPAPGE